MKDFQNLVGASLLRLRMKSPFLATLALFARLIPTQYLFFQKVAARWDQQAQAVCVYLTHGYGDFPKQPSGLPVL